MDSVEVRNIFAAVFAKKILAPLLEILDKNQVKFWGTEGTAKYLKSKGFSAKSVVAGFDFDGRVKSLDRENFVRILADRSKKKHLNELKKLSVKPFDLVVVDLYKPDQSNFPESMDIGGQALIRAAIKNYQNVALAFDEKSIADVVSELKKNNGSISLQFRKSQAKKSARFISKRCNLELRLITKI